MNSTDTCAEDTPLATLLARVERGEQLTITRHGRPVARLVPVEPPDQSDASEAVRELRELRKGNRLDGLSFRGLVEEGRSV